MRKLAIALLLVICSVTLRAEDTPKPVLKKGARVAIVGDSITEQKLYSKIIEVYLTACQPQLELKFIQLGWGGETAGGFQNRMNNDLLPWKPDVVTTCYGMNDGGYQAYNEGIGKRYSGPMAEIVKRIKDSGAVMVVGGPGVVDTKYFRNGGEAAKVYNDNLEHLSDIAKKLAADNGFNFADVHHTMLQAMEKSKAAYGEAYAVGGGDGVHPAPNGHLLMAYAYLKAMGLDGDIGTITLDMKAQATATDGHKVLTSGNGKAEIESTRYPFCFFGKEKDANGTFSMLPYVNFNQDLNRLTLIVKNLDGEKAKVQWGAAEKVFTKAELEKGINLADQFPVNNPFSTAFFALDGLVFKKQNYETMMIKQAITFFPAIVNALDKDPDSVTAIDGVRKKLTEKQDKLQAEVRAGLVPVKHTITVTAEK
jgi:lysophospholipase L1-like esterase